MLLACKASAARAAPCRSTPTSPCPWLPPSTWKRARRSPGRWSTAPTCCWCACRNGSNCKGGPGRRGKRRRGGAGRHGHDGHPLCTRQAVCRRPDLSRLCGARHLYGYLAQNRQHLFRDEDFAALYCGDNGRTSVAPSLAISILFLRAYEKVSFVEAVDRTKYDLCWKVALGLEMEKGPMQKSTLQDFEAKLVLHERGEALLKKSMEEARRAGSLHSRKIRVALDTTPILGKGGVKETY